MEVKSVTSKTTYVDDRCYEDLLEDFMPRNAAGVVPYDYETVISAATRHFEITQSFQDMEYVAVSMTDKTSDISLPAFMRLDGCSLKDVSNHHCVYTSIDDFARDVGRSERAEIQKRIYSLLKPLNIGDEFNTYDDVGAHRRAGDIPRSAFDFAPSELLVICKDVRKYDAEVRVFVIDDEPKYLFENTNFVLEESTYVGLDTFREIRDFVEDNITSAKSTYTADIGIVNGEFELIELNSLIRGVTGMGPFSNIDLNKYIDDALCYSCGITNML